jgi:tRNA (cytidine/uridine-2'-O-)-methyltransferase
MFGRESTGIPHDVLREHQDSLMRLPMVPDARSLNLSNCVAIVAYEILRQQGFQNLATEETIKGEDFLNKEINN